MRIHPSGTCYYEVAWKIQIATITGQAILSPMSTVAEIEAAIESLPPSQVREVAVWLEERQRMLNSSEALFQMYDSEERACRSRGDGKSG